MSHDQFTQGYQKGNLGCAVKTLMGLRWFFTGGWFSGKVQLAFSLWLVGFLGLLGGDVLLFRLLPVLWAVVATVFGVLLFGTVLSHWLAECVIHLALHDRQFFEMAIAERALIVLPDDEVDRYPMPTVVTKRSRRHAGH